MVRGSSMVGPDGRSWREHSVFVTLADPGSFAGRERTHRTGPEDTPKTITPRYPGVHPGITEPIP